MNEEVLVPSVGESITQGVLSAWLKQEGERVEEGEDLFELETDKATVAVPSPAEGIVHIQVPAGQEVEIGQVVGSVEVGAQARAAAAQAASREAAAPQAAAARAAPGQAKPVQGGPEGEEVEAPVLSPAVRRIVEEQGLDPRRIRGTGPKGRITKEDALRAAEEKAVVEPSAASAVVSSPSAATAATQPAGGERRVPMTGLRKTIAARLLQARQGTALLTTFNEIDMERVIAVRKAHGESFEKAHGVRLGFMSFFVKACCQALSAFPLLNAWIEDDEVVYHDACHLGVAVSTERGLLVPILRDAEALSFAEIESRILDLARRARDKKITPDELAGGTFTITNGGIFGSLLSTPLPNYPQSAILGMHAIQDRPVAVDGQVVIKPMMYVALSYDHRLIDGREAVQFLVRIKNLVEDPERLLIGA
jgi:2-oxoglutarate dehydrogenase E2 component (dihydrolipoamide succinyltransferase)